MSVTVNSGEYKSRVGLDNLYVAQVTQDDASGYVADTPQYFAPAADANQEPAVSEETQYLDDQAAENIKGEGPTKITMTVSAIPVQMLALITGRQFDAASGRMWDSGDPTSTQYFALLFRSKKSNGKYRYYSYLKGSFEMPKEEAATNKDKPDIKNAQIIFTAIRTKYQFTTGASNISQKRVVGDEDTTNFSAAGWFSQVQTPVVTVPSALSLSSSSPAGAATGVLTSATLTLTFNNALAADAPYNVTLINSATGAVVAGANTLSGANKVLTVGHSDALAGATLHRIVYSVIDVFGQHLAGTVSFTTA